jgi:hypothetical protein
MESDSDLDKAFGIPFQFARWRISTVREQMRRERTVRIRVVLTRVAEEADDFRQVSQRWHWGECPIK